MSFVALWCWEAAGLVPLARRRVQRARPLVQMSAAALCGSRSCSTRAT